MIPANFDYHRPASVDEAVGLLDRYGGDGAILAGGHSLIPMMKLRFPTPGHLIDLKALDELRDLPGPAHPASPTRGVRPFAARPKGVLGRLER